MTHVWAISPYWHPDFSGAAIQAARILPRLLGRGFRVTVLTPADHLSAELRGRRVESDGLVIRYLPVVTTRSWDRFAMNRRLLARVRFLNRLAGGFSFYARCAWILTRQGSSKDIVQLYSSRESQCLVTTCARRLGMHPVMQLTLLGSDDPSSISRTNRRIVRQLKLAAFRQADAIVGCSTAQVDSCMAAGLDSAKVIRIPACVDVDLYRPVETSTKLALRAQLGLPVDRRYIIFVGSATRRKGIDVLVRAFLTIARQTDDVDLLVVGPQDFTKRTRQTAVRQSVVNQLSEELNRSEYASRVHWTGEVDDVRHYLQAADVFCFPTRQEGFGVVIAEAMAVGLPAVVARLDGVTTDLIRSDEEGVLISGHDPAEYARALLALLNDPAVAQRMGCGARAWAATAFDLEVTAQRFAELYRGLSHTLSASANTG